MSEQQPAEQPEDAETRREREADETLEAAIRNWLKAHGGDGEEEFLLTGYVLAMEGKSLANIDSGTQASYWSALDGMASSHMIGMVDCLGDDLREYRDELRADADG